VKNGLVPTPNGRMIVEALPEGAAAGD